MFLYAGVALVDARDIFLQYPPRFLEKACVLQPVQQRRQHLRRGIAQQVPALGAARRVPRLGAGGRARKRFRAGVKPAAVAPVAVQLQHVGAASSLMELVHVLRHQRQALWMALLELGQRNVPGIRLDAPPVARAAACTSPTPSRGADGRHPRRQGLRGGSCSKGRFAHRGTWARRIRRSCRHCRATFGARATGSGVQQTLFVHSSKGALHCAPSPFFAAVQHPPSKKENLHHVIAPSALRQQRAAGVQRHH